ALLGDLTEGKLTLPLIRVLADRPALVAEVEAVRSGDGEAAGRIAAAVRESGVCDGVRARAREETSQALAALETVPPSAARDVLAAIATELTSRVA
ncbi:MAG: polyprenyl synthetase family protein, partial [Polyangiaceae bacterium]